MGFMKSSIAIALLNFRFRLFRTVFVKQESGSVYAGQVPYEAVQRGALLAHQQLEATLDQPLLPRLADQVADGLEEHAWFTSWLGSWNPEMRDQIREAAGRSRAADARARPVPSSPRPLSRPGTFSGRPRRGGVMPPAAILLLR